MLGLLVVGVLFSASVAVGFRATVCTEATVTVQIGSVDSVLTLATFPANESGFSLLEVTATNFSVGDLQFYDGKWNQRRSFSPGRTKVPDVSILNLCFSGRCYYVGCGIFNGTVYMQSQFFGSDWQIYSYGNARCDKFSTIEYSVPEESCTRFTAHALLISSQNNETVATFGALFALNITTNRLTGQVTEAQAPKHFFHGYGDPEMAHWHYNATTLSTPLKNDSLHDLRLRWYTGFYETLSSNRLLAVSVRQGHVYWPLDRFPTKANPCMSDREIAGGQHGNYVAVTTICCTNFERRETKNTNL